MWTSFHLISELLTTCCPLRRLHYLLAAAAWIRASPFTGKTDKHHTWYAPMVWLLNYMFKTVFRLCIKTAHVLLRI